MTYKIQIMKKTNRSFLSIPFIAVLGLLLTNYPVGGQEAPKGSPVLPENINTIVTKSCMPCHSAQGGLMPRTKLNFTEWTNYPTAKQADKAKMMASVLKKGTMPPKSARENHPENIPTQEQIDTISKWAESLNPEPGR
jgi:cytochrome c5